MRVLIFGISGQDGIILANLLTKKKIDFLGVVRSKDIPKRLINFSKKIVFCNFLNENSIFEIIRDSRPSHVVNLIGQSSVGKSFEFVEETYKANFEIANWIGRSILKLKNIYFLNASSAYIFDCSKPISYYSPIKAISPYAKSKAAAYKELSSLFKEENYFISMHFFNHLSKYSDQRFVIPKIIDYFQNSKNCKLNLASITKIRNWGISEDYMNIVINIILKKRIDLKKDYFIGSNFESSIENILEEIAKLFKKDYILEIEDGRNRPHDPDKVSLSKDIFHSQGINLPSYTTREFAKKLIF
tara:strand:- start:891 stop:1793 length:903 start_codon:yes stop_codon:yes gene_type:complete